MVSSLHSLIFSSVLFFSSAFLQKSVSSSLRQLRRCSLIPTAVSPLPPPRPVEHFPPPPRLASSFLLVSVGATSEPYPFAYRADKRDSPATTFKSFIKLPSLSFPLGGAARFLNFPFEPNFSQTAACGYTPLNETTIKISLRGGFCPFR